MINWIKEHYAELVEFDKAFLNFLEKWDGKYSQWGSDIDDSGLYVQIIVCPHNFEMSEELYGLELDFLNLPIFTIMTPTYIPFNQLKELIND